MRIIDADELKELILYERDKIPLTLPGATYELGIEKPNHYGNAMRGGLRKALRCMEKCVTIEAEPVRRGKWVWVKDHWECTRCRGSRHHDISLGLDAAYCGRCGAKMV